MSFAHLLALEFDGLEAVYEERLAAASVLQRGSKLAQTDSPAFTARAFAGRAEELLPGPHPVNDFRLMRRCVFEKVVLTRSSGVICVELMKKVQDHGFRIAEVPVDHFHRSYGKSQFFNFPRVARSLVDFSACSASSS